MPRSTPASDTILAGLEVSALKLLKELRSRALVPRIRLYEILVDMQLSGTVRNEREIFYMAVDVFRTQSTVRRLVASIAMELRVSKSALGIRNTLKGIFIGTLGFATHGCTDIVEMTSRSSTPQLIPDMTAVSEVFCSYERVVVVEKDTILQRIANEASGETWLEKTLLICGKGYPCRNTILLLRMLEHKAAITGLFDFDPFGIHIYCVYKYGTRESPGLGISTMTRAGICIEDILEHGIHEDDFTTLNRHDRAMIGRLVQVEEVSRDLLFLKRINKKVEMEALLSKGAMRLRHFLSKAFGM